MAYRIPSHDISITPPQAERAAPPQRAAADSLAPRSAEAGSTAPSRLTAEQKEVGKSNFQRIQVVHDQMRAYQPRLTSHESAAYENASTQAYHSSLGNKPAHEFESKLANLNEVAADARNRVHNGERQQAGEGLRTQLDSVKSLVKQAGDALPPPSAQQRDSQALRSHNFKELQTIHNQTRAYEPSFTTAERDEYTLAFQQAYGANRPSVSQEGFEEKLSQFHAISQNLRERVEHDGHEPSALEGEATAPRSLTLQQKELGRANFKALKAVQDQTRPHESQFTTKERTEYTLAFSAAYDASKGDVPQEVFQNRFAKFIGIASDARTRIEQGKSGAESAPVQVSKSPRKRMGLSRRLNQELHQAEREYVRDLNKTKKAVHKAEIAERKAARKAEQAEQKAARKAEQNPSRSIQSELVRKAQNARTNPLVRGIKRQLEKLPLAPGARESMGQTATPQSPTASLTPRGGLEYPEGSVMAGVESVNDQQADPQFKADFKNWEAGTRIKYSGQVSNLMRETLSMPKTAEGGFVKTEDAEWVTEQLTQLRDMRVANRGLGDRQVRQETRQETSSPRPPRFSERIANFFRGIVTNPFAFLRRSATPAASTTNQT